MPGRYFDDARGRVRGLLDRCYLCLDREHLVRTCTIAVVVGSWLTLFNQGDTILTSDIDTVLVAKVGLNYLTPFVVANLGLVSRRRGPVDGH